MTNKQKCTWSRSRKTLVIVGAAVLSITFGVLAFLFQPAYATSAETLVFAREAVTQQQAIEKDLRAYYQMGKYTFEEPLVIQNPYKTAPLTALLIFDTPEDSQISIHVPGKVPQADVDFTFAGYQKHHEVPVYGLYAGMLNHVTVSMKTKDGASVQTELDLQTEPLPVYIQEFHIDVVNPDKYSPGFNFTFLDRKPVFDVGGNVRWYSTQDSWQVFTRLKNGHFLFTYSVGGLEGNLLVEEDLLGKKYAIYNIPDGIHHDIYELPTGNWLLTSSDLTSTMIEDIILEVDPNNGHTVKSFDLKKYLDTNRLTVMDANSFDWIHVNSIVYDPKDDTIIISSRTQSAVIKMTYPGMQIKWILGPLNNWGAKYQPYLLTPVGEIFEWSWAQHHATIYGSDKPGDNVVDILLFDNGTYRSFYTETAQSPLEWYSRVVLYRVDEAAMTIEQVWEYGKERGSTIFSSFRGSAYLLANGNILGTWSDIYKDAEGNPLPTIKSTDTNVSYTSKIIEVDPTDNAVVFESTSPDRYTYRAMRSGLYDGYSEGNDLLLTTLNDTTGNDLVDRSVLAWRDVNRWLDAGKQWSYTNPVMLALRRFGRRILGVIR